MRNYHRQFFSVKRHEWPFVLNMFSYFFLVITNFWILKPLKKTLFFQFYKVHGGFTILSYHMSGAQAELLAKIFNMLAAVIAVFIFSWLSQKFKREKLTWIFAGAFIGWFIFFGFTLTPLTELVVWVFYVTGDMFATIMVAAFFAFLNDSVSPEVAKRLYGPIGLGGVLGGAVGSSFEALYIHSMSAWGWMMVCIVLTGVIALNAYLAMRNVDGVTAQHELVHTTPTVEHEEREGTGSLLDGAKMTFKSPYLLSIGMIVCLYEIVSALVDFQFSAAFEHSYTSAELGRHFADLFARNNWAALFVQVFVTGFVMRRFGLTPALLTLPVAEMAGAVAFIAFPVAGVAGMLSTFDNGFSYSINQSAKEALYVTTPRPVKYKAKAFIDMFLQRFGKAIAVVLSLLLTMYFKDFSTVRWISMVTLAVGIVWILCARYAGRIFDNAAKLRMTAGKAAEPAEDLTIAKEYSV